jgi:beta-aspartyl-peptidase (threonine type)
MVDTLLHGGAWHIPDAEHDDHRRGLRDALAAARRLAARPALDIAIEAVRVLEADGAFDAGRGAVLNSEGRVELDACVMEGTTRRAGAVAAVQRLLHPVALARLVMERTPHVLLVGDGASRFADACGLPRIPEEQLVCERERTRLDALLSRRARSDAGPRGTGGALVRDRDGRLAAATSTGGTAGKLPGRVGDSPLPGVATFADDRVGALSTTGNGEAIVRASLGVVVSEALRLGAGAADAIQRGFERLAGNGAGQAGLILLGRDGDAWAGFSTPTMAVAWDLPTGSGAEVLRNDTPGSVRVVSLPAAR